MIEGLLRAVRVARLMAATSRANGQDDGGPDALEQLAVVLENETDTMKTPPLGVEMCPDCSKARLR